MRGAVVVIVLYNRLTFILPGIIMIIQILTKTFYNVKPTNDKENQPKLSAEAVIK